MHWYARWTASMPATAIDPMNASPANTPAFPRVCIYGAGAIGAWIGARLGQIGCHVSVVARGETLQALQRDGLLCQFADNAGGLVRTAVQASADPKELGVQDLVIVAVKAPSMADVARQIGPLLGPDTVVLTAMNGVPWWFLQGFGGALQGKTLEAVDPGGVISQAIAPRHVVGGVVHASCSLAAPGCAKHHFGNRLIIGEPSGHASDRVHRLDGLFVDAGFEIERSAQIQKDVWYKLWGNMTVNPVSALTGATTDRILADPLVRDFISRIMLEAKEIGARIGIPIHQQPEDRHAVTAKLGAFKTSMLQDVEARRSVEIDALVTAVQELGRLTDVETPFTDTLLGLSRLQARTLGLY